MVDKKWEPSERAASRSRLAPIFASSSDPVSAAALNAQWSVVHTSFCTLNACHMLLVLRAFFRTLVQQRRSHGVLAQNGK